MERFILFLIRCKLGVKRGEWFQFTNQKSDAKYCINSYAVMKLDNGSISLSDVSLNWILDPACEIRMIKEV